MNGLLGRSAHSTTRDDKKARAAKCGSGASPRRRLPTDRRDATHDDGSDVRTGPGISPAHGRTSAWRGGGHLEARTLDQPGAAQPVEPSRRQHLLQPIVERVDQRAQCLRSIHHQLALDLAPPTQLAPPRPRTTSSKAARAMSSTGCHLVDGTLSRAGLVARVQ